MLLMIANSCARNCFQCPIPACTAVLTVTVVETLKGETEAAPTYGLQCPSCRWTSSELGSKWVFPKSSGIGRMSQSQSRYALAEHALSLM